MLGDGFAFLAKQRGTKLGVVKLEEEFMRLTWDPIVVGSYSNLFFELPL